MTACAECGFRYEETPPEEVGAAIVAGADDVAALLRGPGVRLRPRPEVWSALEYACHLRDMLLVQRERVLLARREEQPVAVPMGRDERVEHEGYNEQEPADVARQLADAARLLANVLRRLPGEAWQLTLIYTYPEPAERPLSWVAAHTLHEVRHHRMDIERRK
ncbi:DinB family protein [Actinoplanes sp. NPDC051343]|uniref:DinB family protein n=1 Tax=Actinoplanes sp. NPDC051343 TaxID=3363906 RepID=UPI0037957341